MFLDFLIDDILNEILKKLNPEYKIFLSWTCKLFLEKIKIKIDKNIMGILSRNNDLTLYKYIKNMKYPICFWDLNYFALNGNLKAVKYILKNECSWNNHSFQCVVRTGNLKAVKYFKENGCPYSERTFSNAVFYGNLDIVKYLFDNDCPIDKWTYHVSKKASLEILDYLNDNKIDYITPFYSRNGFLRKK